MEEEMTAVKLMIGTIRDYYEAACADAQKHDLTLTSLKAAYEVSVDGRQFYWAVQGAIMLKGILK